jgi:hypothetical protein
MFPGWPSGSEEDLWRRVSFTSTKGWSFTVISDSSLVIAEDPMIGIDGPGIGAKVSGKARDVSAGNHVGDMFR